MINGLSYIQVSSVCTVCTASVFLEENEMVSLVLSIELKLRREWNDLPMIFKSLFYYYGSINATKYISTTVTVIFST